jgi:hypothetical protein
MKTTTEQLTALNFNALAEFRDCFEPKEKNTRINTKGVEDEDFFKNVGGNLNSRGYLR